jgi:hypothetical protein
MGISVSGAWNAAHGSGVQVTIGRDAFAGKEYVGKS